MTVAFVLPLKLPWPGLFGRLQTGTNSPGKWREGGERENEREGVETRQRERERDRQTDRQTDRQRQRERERDTDTDREREREREGDKGWGWRETVPLSPQLRAALRSVGSSACV